MDKQTSLALLSLARAMLELNGKIIEIQGLMVETKEIIGQANAERYLQTLRDHHANFNTVINEFLKVMSDG